MKIEEFKTENDTTKMNEILENNDKVLSEEDLEQVSGGKYIDRAVKTVVEFAIKKKK